LIKPELLIPVALYPAWKRAVARLRDAAPAIAGSIAGLGLTAALHYPAYLLDSTTWSRSGVATNDRLNWSGIIAMKWDPAEFRLAAAAVASRAVATIAVLAHASRGTAAPRSQRYALECLLVSPFAPYR
jgi:hypothetical protein